jgi:AcrR family transcriptional regulator
MTKKKTGPDSFTDAEVAKAALSILRADGPQALSFRNVAEALGTYHVAVFRRCGGFDGLLDMCADHLAAKFPVIDGSVNWAEATQQRFEAAYKMWAANVELLLLMRGRAWQGNNMVTRFYEPAMRTLLQAGLPPREAAYLFSILYRLTLGSVIAVMANPWTPTEATDAIEALGAENFPSLVKVRADVEFSDIDEVFRSELRRLIEGLGPVGTTKPSRAAATTANGARRPRQPTVQPVKKVGQARR